MGERADPAANRARSLLDAPALPQTFRVEPARDTLYGEKPEVYPFLGSYLLGAAIDGCAVDLAVHGHAHHGTERGITAGGTPVRNVAMPVLRAPFNVYEFGD